MEEPDGRSANRDVCQRASVFPALKGDPLAEDVGAGGSKEIFVELGIWSVSSEA